MSVYRQGDILLRKLSSVEVVRFLALADTGAKVVVEKDKECVVGYGEASGHTHLVEKGTLVVEAVSPERSGTLRTLGEWRVGRAEMPVWVVVEEPTNLSHVDGQGEPTGDHDKIAIEPGVYEVIRQREFQPLTGRTSLVWD